MPKLKPYAREYLYNGKRWVMTFEAESQEDANRRMNAAYMNGTSQQIVGTLDCPRWLVKAVV